MSISLDNKQIGFEHSKQHNLKQSIQFSEGAIVSKIISKRDTGNVTLFAFDHGQFLSEHTAPFDAIIQIVEGAATVTINKVEYELLEGELIIMPANIPHAVLATDKMKMMLIMIRS